jgi:chromosome segregation protein
LQARIEVLENLQQSGEGAGDGARLLLEQSGDKVLGLWADYIRVADEYAQALEVALGEQLQVLLIKNSSLAQELLQEAAARQSSVWMAAADWPLQTTERPDLGGQGQWLEELVNVRDEATTWSKQFLYSYALVGDLQTAWNLAQKYSGQQWIFISRDGYRVGCDGLLRSPGESGAGASMLQRAQELEKLQAELNALLGAISLLEDAELRGAELLEVLQEQKEEARENLQEEKNLLREQASKVQFLENHLNSAQNRFQHLSDRLQSLELQQEQIRQSISGGDTELAELSAQKEALENSWQDASERLEEIQEQLEAVQEEYEECSRELGEWKQKKSSLEQQIHFKAQQMESMQSLVDNRKERIRFNREEHIQVESGDSDLEDRLEKEYAKLETLTHQRDDAKAIYDERMADLDEYRDEVKELNQMLRAQGDESHEVEMKMEAQRSNADRIKERMFEQFEVYLDDKEGLPLVEYNLDTVEKDIRELRSALRKLGPVNPGALDEYEAEKQRLEVVEKQFEDLDQARMSLERTVDKLDSMARAAFMETFVQVRKNFQDVFSSLMIGGKTRLELEDGVDPLEARIEINAQPTGKKMRGVTLLSGGERALTATALLFALYLVKPSPYCILDEVDGPLDDANIGRFVQLLRRFSRHTQFIIITHNKRTMAASDRLYGVTQEIKGISRIASVQLDEAADISLQ